MNKKGKILFNSILLFFLSGSLAYSSINKNIQVSGYVYDEFKNTIRNSRVEVFLHNNELKEKFQVIYTNKKGFWQTEIPSGSKISIKIYSNGFKPEQKEINFTRNLIIDDGLKISTILKKGLKHIEWGSFDHLMLYVSGSMQKQIEELVEKSDVIIVKKYIFKASKKNRINILKYAGYISFIKDKMESSRYLFDLADSKLWFNLMGRRYIKLKEYTMAFQYYLNGITTRLRAHDFYFLANIFERVGEKELSRKCYSAAASDFNDIIGNFKFNVDKNILKMRYKAFKKLNEIKVDSGSEIKEILNKVGEYCKKLKQADIYFYCTEEKVDKVILNRYLYQALNNPQMYYGKYKPPRLNGMKVINKYVYNLQLVINDSGLIEEAKKLVHYYPDMKERLIPVMSYNVDRPLYGPNSLIGFGWQKYFNYSIEGRDNSDGKKVVIVNAIPKWDSYVNQMYGKLWINSDDGSITKIEWKHQNLYREDLRIRGLILNLDPEMKFVSFFGKLRNGLRFPSGYRIIEYYHKNDKEFIRLDITGTYKKYAFFDVDINKVKIENN
ncbi:MAG: hypothetical protein ABFR75_12075 [Acidobacteriota bacterium]